MQAIKKAKAPEVLRPTYISELVRVSKHQVIKFTMHYHINSSLIMRCGET
jgi:hypothetical protein